MEMVDLLPLRFAPILREYIWGGRRLAELGKKLGSGDRYAESWEVVDHGNDQSVVKSGPLEGVTLHELVEKHGEKLLGRHAPLPQFPLLFKYLDCQRTLSVQVHPNDEQGAKLSPPDLGKTEAWVVLAAEPGSQIYAGLKPGIDRAALEHAVASGQSESCLYAFEPRVGDCLLIEAGTVHALGAGLLVAEIQQASNTTFRLFDWNRVDQDGRPRTLHIQESLDTIDYSRGPARPAAARPLGEPGSERLVSCDKFVLDRHRVDRSRTWNGDERFHILSVIDGAATLRAGMEHEPLSRGDTILVPACIKNFMIEPQEQAVVLDMFLP